MWLTFAAFIIFLLNSSGLSNFLILFRFLHLLYVVASCWHGDHLIIMIQSNLPNPGASVPRYWKRHLPKKCISFLTILLEQMWKKPTTFPNTFTKQLILWALLAEVIILCKICSMKRRWDPGQERGSWRAMKKVGGWELYSAVWRTNKPDPSSKIWSLERKKTSKEKIGR